MSNHADSLTLRLARPEEHEELEDLQRRASLELPEYRDQLILHPDAIYLPEGQIANGQVIVAGNFQLIASSLPPRTVRRFFWTAA